MRKSGFITQTEFQSHLDKHWSVVHGLWPKIRGLAAPSPPDGGGIPGGFTPGSVAFAGTHGLLTQDNPNFFYDAANVRWGYGTATPDVTIDIEFDAVETVVARISAKTRPWWHWECVDGNWGLAIGITANDDVIHFNYDSPIGTKVTSMMVFDGGNTRVGILEDTPLHPFDVGGNTRIQGDLLVTGNFTSDITIANGFGLNLQEDINFTGANGVNLILFPDNLAAALQMREGANAYISFRTTDGSERIDVYKTLNCNNIIIANGFSLSLQEDITFTGATAQNLIKFPDNLPTALDFREGANSYLLFRTSDGTEGVTIGKALTLSSIAAGGADYDKFLVSDTGLVKYRTGAQVLSDLSGAAGAAFAWNGQNLTGIGTIGSGAITSTGTSSFAKLGIGTAAVPHGGVGTGILALEGGDQDMATSPVVQWTTDADDYPLMQIGFWKHDGMWMFWDAYSDAAGTDKSSDVGSNFGLRKTADTFQIIYDSGIAQGNAVTWNVGFAMDASGDSVFTTGGNFEMKAVATDSRGHITTYATAAGKYSRYIMRTSDTDTIDTLSETQSDDYLGIFEFQGVSSTPSWGDGAYIVARQNGASGAVYVPTDLFFITYSATGANANQLVLHHDGGVGLGTSTPTYLFDAEWGTADWVGSFVNTHATTPYGLLLHAPNAAATFPLIGALSSGGWCFRAMGDGDVIVGGCISDGTCEIMKNENALAIIDDMLKTGSGEKDEYDHERMDMKKIHNKYPFMIHEQIGKDNKKEYFDKLGAKSDLIYVAIGQLKEKIEALEAQLNN